MTNPTRRSIVKSLAGVVAAAVMPMDFWLRQRTLGAEVTKLVNPFGTTEDIADAIFHEGDKFVMPKGIESYCMDLLRGNTTYGYQRGDAVGSHNGTFSARYPSPSNFQYSPTTPVDRTGLFRRCDSLGPHTVRWEAEKFPPVLTTWEELAEELIRQIWDGHEADGPFLDVTTDTGYTHAFVRYSGGSTYFVFQDSHLFAPRFVDMDGRSLIVHISQIRQIVVRGGTSIVPYAQRRNTSRMARKSKLHWLRDPELSPLDVNFGVKSS